MNIQQAIGLSTAAERLGFCYTYLYQESKSGDLETIQVIVGKRTFRVVTLDALDKWYKSKRRRKAVAQSIEGQNETLVTANN